MRGDAGVERSRSGRAGLCLPVVKVAGLTPAGDLHPDVFAQINEALLRHEVLFIREQDHLDAASQEAFARLFAPRPLAARAIRSRAG